MKTFHVESIAPLESFDSLMQAHFAAEHEHEVILGDLSFDISQYFGKTISEFFYCESSLALQFSDNKFFTIDLCEQKRLTLSGASRKMINQNISNDEFCLIFPDGDIEIWNPQLLLEKYRTKRFMNIHMSYNRLYLYFYDCELLISVSVLTVVEPPFRILRLSESD